MKVLKKIEHFTLGILKSDVLKLIK